MANFNVPSYYKLPSDITIPTGSSNIVGMWKFGFTADITGDERTVWDGVGITDTNANYLFTASKIQIVSDNANDTADGTGARSSIVSGLNGDPAAFYRMISEEVPLNGTSPVETSNSFIGAVFRQSVGSHTNPNAISAGNIYAFTGTATDGIPDDINQIYSIISPGINQTLQCNFTIPANMTGLMDFIDTTALGNNNADVTFRLLMRPLGGVMQTKRKIVLSQNSVPRPWRIPPPIEEKTDVEIRAQRTSGSGSVSVTAEFDLRLVPIS